MSDLNRFCMICGAREGEHAGYDNRCPHPNRDIPGQPMYLNTKFEPYVPKGRTQFPPAHFGRRARYAAEPESDMERDRR
jgi:hypothetical protein